MTYDAREQSFQDGAPVELYKFARGSTVWRYTSADRDVEFEGEDWVSAPLLRSAIEATHERARNAVKIKTRRDFFIADMFRIAPPTDVIGLAIWRYHREDAEKAVIWHGRVLNCEWAGAEAELNCEPVSTSLKRNGLRRMYQKQCPHVLYSQGVGACNVDKADHVIATTVTAVTGIVLSVTALLAKPYGGGFVEWDSGGGLIERRFIRSFSGLDLTLGHAFQGIPLGANVNVYPGCDHTMATCDTVYDALDDYGGFPHTPTKNPFDGTPIY